MIFFYIWHNLLLKYLNKIEDLKNKNVVIFIAQNNTDF